MSVPIAIGGLRTDLVLNLASCPACTQGNTVPGRDGLTPIPAGPVLGCAQALQGPGPCRAVAKKLGKLGKNSDPKKTWKNQIRSFFAGAKTHKHTATAPTKTVTNGANHSLALCEHIAQGAYWLVTCERTCITSFGAQACLGPLNGMQTIAALHTCSRRVGQLRKGHAEGMGAKA